MLCVISKIGEGIVSMQGLPENDCRKIHSVKNGNIFEKSFIPEKNSRQGCMHSVSGVCLARVGRLFGAVIEGVSGIMRKKA